MKREGGLWATAAVLGIVATVGTSTPQPKFSPTPGSSKSTESSSANLLAMESIDKGPCADLEKRLQSFLLVDEKRGRCASLLLSGGEATGSLAKAPDSSHRTALYHRYTTRSPAHSLSSQFRPLDRSHSTGCARRPLYLRLFLAALGNRRTLLCPARRSGSIGKADRAA